MSQNPSNGRVHSIDLLRILSVAAIFLFHTNLHLGIPYGPFTPFVSQGAIFMTAFFAISGFALQYTYQDKDFSADGATSTFLLKRLSSIYPMYLATYALYLAFYNTLSLPQNLIAAPFELLFLQSFFDGTFMLLHNDGTWFLSCLLLCYLLFPLLSRPVRNLPGTGPLLLAPIYGLLVAAPVFVHVFHLGSIYANPFFRFLQFLSGMIVATRFARGRATSGRGAMFHAGVAVATSGILFAIVSILISRGVSKGNFPAYDFVGFPAFLLLVYHGGMIQGAGWDRVLGSRPVQYLSKLSYPLFLAQTFCWDTAKLAMGWLGWNEPAPGPKLLLCAVATCLVVAVLLNELVDRPVGSLVSRFRSRRLNRSAAVSEAG